MKTTAMDLSYDLLLDIFKKLPAGSIPRLKSVCKVWNTLLSGDPWLSTEFPQTMSGLYIDKRYGINKPDREDPTFLALAEPNANNNDNPTNVTFSYVPRDPQSDWPLQIIDVSDGLLLCSSSKRSAFVTNPITETYDLLPALPDERFVINNMFLGYDRRIDDGNYLVLANFVTSGLVRSIESTCVFSRRIGKWIPFDYELPHGKETLVRPPQHHLFWRSINLKACYVDGVFFFQQLAALGDVFTVAVDVDKGLLRIIEIPLEIKDWEQKAHYYSLAKDNNGCLVYGGFTILDSRREDGQQVRSRVFRMWGLEDVRGDNWELKTTFEVKSSMLDDLVLSPNLHFRFHMDAFHPNYEIVFFEKRRFLFALGMRSKNITKICSGLSHSQSFFVYTPLLVDIFANPIEHHH